MGSEVEIIEREERSGSGKELTIEKDDLPLTIIYKNKRYILILTRNDKLILNK